MTDALPVQPLPWDSHFFGFGVARVTVAHLEAAAWQQIQAKAHAAGYRLLYVIADPREVDTAATLASAGLARISRLVTYTMDLAAARWSPSSVPGIQIVPTATLTPALEALAWESGVCSRFHLDPKLPPTTFQALYSEWLRKSLSGQEMARQVLSARLTDGSEVGLLTLGEQNGCADIGLLAIAVEQRGRGIGQLLLATAGQQARQWGHTHIQVVTQAENQPANRFYEQAGFALTHQQDVYHCWLTENNAWQAVVL